MGNEVILCPGCGVENPKTRVTCQICHVQLYPRRNPMEESQSEVKPPETPSKPKKGNGRRKPRKTRKPRTPKQATPETPKETPETPVKKKRQRKPKSFPIQYFALSGQQLIPIAINLQVKPIKKRTMKAEGQTLISLWNRNKSLLK